MSVRPVLATLVCAVVFAACASTDASQPVEPAGASCDQFAASRTIEQTRTIDAGTDLTVVLCSNPSTGFSWGEPQIADVSVIGLGQRAFHESGATTLPVVGAAGADVFTVHGLAAGTTTLTITYGQPWPGGVHDMWAYRLTVTVR